MDSVGGLFPASLRVRQTRAGGSVRLAVFDAAAQAQLSWPRSAIIAYGTTALLLILQPDFGMLMMVTGIWATQYFLNGLRISYILGGLVGIMVLVLIAYLSLSHVATRIDTF
jgi:cell division protein FtsW (lipid II flippase)